MSLDKARMPKLADKIRTMEAEAEEKRSKLEKADDEKAKIIKKSAKKN